MLFNVELLHFPNEGCFATAEMLGKNVATNFEKDALGTGENKVDINRRESPFKVIEEVLFYVLLIALEIAENSPGILEEKFLRSELLGIPLKVP